MTFEMINITFSTPILIITIVAMIGMVNSQPWTPYDYCPMANFDINSMQTDRDLVFVYINESFTTFRLDRLSRPVFGQLSNKNWLDYGKITLDLSPECAQHATIKNYRGVELVNRRSRTRVVYLNVRFQRNRVRSCPRLDTIFMLNLETMLYEHVTGLDGSQQVIYTPAAQLYFRTPYANF